MKEGGVIKSDFCRDPIKPLDQDTKNLLLNLKYICKRAEQSIPSHDLPPHRYFVFKNCLKILVYVGFFLII